MVGKCFALLLLLTLLGQSSSLCPIDGQVLGQYRTLVKTPTFGGKDLLVFQNSSNIAFDWGTNSPHPLVPLDNFYISWDVELTPPSTGNYFFRVRSDDGFRLYLNNTLIISFWADRVALDTDSAAIFLTAGTWTNLRLEFYENGVFASVGLFWKFESGTFVAIPSSSFRYQGCGLYMTPVVSLSATGSGLLQVVLTSAPSSEVTVTLTSILPLSICQIKFNSTNWNVPVSVIVYPDANNFGAGVNNVTITGNTECKDSRFNNLTGTSNVERANLPGAKGTSWGDPHFVTFDGSTFDFYEIGDYYLVRQLNSEFIVQSRQNQCGSVSCNYGVAIRFKNAAFFVYVTRDGVPSTFASGDLRANGLTVSTINNEYKIQTSTLASVNVKIGRYGFHYLNIEVELPSLYRGQVRGLLGDFDGVKTNDFQNSFGGVQTDQLIFKRGWKVSSTENLFMDPTASIGTLPAGSISAISSSSLRSICSNVVNPNDKTDKIQESSKNKTLPEDLKNTTDLFDPDFVPAVPDFKNKTIQDEANKTCTEYFYTSELARSCIELGLDPSQFYQACMVDYALTGDKTFVVDSANSFYSKCVQKGAENGTDSTKNPTPVTCPNFCSNQGVCLVGGVCSCFEGFNGTDCSEDLNQPPTVVSFSNSSPGECDQKITINGKNFYSSITFKCKFGSSIVLASRISNFELICSLPNSVYGENIVLELLGENNSLIRSINGLKRNGCCNQPCVRGTCVGNFTSFTCQCPSNYFGQFCQTYSNACSSSPCQSGTTCTDTENGYRCGCSGAPVFMGPSTKPAPPVTANVTVSVTKKNCLIYSESIVDGGFEIIVDGTQQRLCCRRTGLIQSGACGLISKKTICPSGATTSVFTSYTNNYYIISPTVCVDLCVAFI